MMNQLQPWGLLGARILLAWMFLVAGYDKIGGFAGTAKYMAAKGMPLVEPLLVATIILEIVGGLMLVIGWKARWAAWALLAFTLVANLVFHDFWALPAEQARMQAILFYKNLAVMGGMLYVALMGPGRLSLDKS
jgi:putative oxidoreductase